jgi:hypothetical protein
MRRNAAKQTPTEGKRRDRVVYSMCHYNQAAGDHHTRSVAAGRPITRPEEAALTVKVDNRVELQYLSSDHQPINVPIDGAQAFLMYYT